MNNSAQSKPSQYTSDVGVQEATNSSESEKVELSVQLDPDLLRQVNYLTDNPSKVIEVALRQWLRSGARRDDDLTRNLERNPPVPARGEWND
ncbi:MAG: type II toxin-antitoxin system CcdA family antitoxin [Elainellaceae cyanobacterium]